MPEANPSELDHGWGTILVTLPGTDNLKYCRWTAAPGDTSTSEQTGRFMA
jgi:hypothetical protein